MANVKSIRDLDVAGKTALVRVDYNVPFRPGSTDISDDSRIRASLPTLRHLQERGCRIIVCSHLGRPKGRVVESLRMAPVSQRLSELLETPVVQARQCVGEAVASAAASLAPGGVLMLENLRFHPGEEGNDAEFARGLASLADVYINDAFGAAHRAHASTAAVARLLPAAAGFLMERELQFLGDALDAPERPFAAVLGGAKVSDKIGVLENLMGKVDLLVVGGGMAATFIKAQGHSVGDSLVEDDRLAFARRIMDADQRGYANILIPDDVIVAYAFAADADMCVATASAIPDGWRIMDIGPQTARRYADALGECRTVIWNGPMGVFEWDAFSQGTAAVANALAGMERATTITGGGSTAEAVAALGLANKMTHISSGGGASLEFMEGRELPGVAALMDNR